MSTAPARGAMLEPGLLRARLGVVSSFDEAVGVGEVTEPGGSTYPFHCSAIFGGGRTIAVDTAVHFLLHPYHGGVVQANDLIPLAG